MTCDVLIVGAGAAGLQAAYMLAAQGVNVLIAEGRKRVGGRILTFRPGGFSHDIEAGAEFVHGKLPLTQSLASSAGTHLTQNRGLQYFFEAGSMKRATEVFNGRYWRALMKELYAMKEEISVEEFLHSRFEGAEFLSLREQVRRFVNGYQAADTLEASASAFREEFEEHESENEYRVDRGYGYLIAYLAERVKSSGAQILTERDIRQVAWQPGSAAAVDANGSMIRCRRLVVTVPLGVLHAGRIHFDPAPTEALKAALRIGYGNVIKFKLEFTRSFYLRIVKRTAPEMSFIFSDAECQRGGVNYPMIQQSLPAGLPGLLPKKQL